MAKATKKRAKASKTGPGRPKGSKNLTPEGIAVLSTSKINRLDETAGYKRIVIATVDADHALRLQKLAGLVEKNDRNLLKLITPPSLTKTKKVSKKKVTKRSTIKSTA